VVLEITNSQGHIIKNKLHQIVKFVSPKDVGYDWKILLLLNKKYLP